MRGKRRKSAEPPPPLPVRRSTFMGVYDPATDQLTFRQVPRVGTWDYIAAELASVGALVAASPEHYAGVGAANPTQVLYYTGRPNHPAGTHCDGRCTHSHAFRMLMYMSGLSSRRVNIFGRAGGMICGRVVMFPVRFNEPDDGCRAEGVMMYSGYGSVERAQLDDLFDKCKKWAESS